MNFRPVLFLIASLLVGGCGHDSSGAKSEPLYQEQWALHYDKPFYDAYNVNPNAHINGENAMNRYRGRGVKIAVIDIGLDADHPEFKNNIIQTVNSRDGSQNVSCTGYNNCYHGTAVTGVIAADINGVGLRGIAPEAEIVFIKLDLNGYLSDSEIIDAFEYAEASGADIVSCSWGTGDVSPLVQENIDRLANEGRNGKGIVFVFAAGNEGKETINDESMLESVIGVGSSDEENLRAVYSNFGEGLDVVAPGGYMLGITTAKPEGYMAAEDYDKFQGTSASAPIVAAGVALMLEADPNLTRVQIQTLLRQNADTIGTVAYVNGHNPYYGYGKINLDRAIDAL